MSDESIDLFTHQIKVEILVMDPMLSGTFFAIGLLTNDTTFYSRFSFCELRWTELTGFNRISNDTTQPLRSTSRNQNHYIVGHLRGFCPQAKNNK